MIRTRAVQLLRLACLILCAGASDLVRAEETLDTFVRAQNAAGRALFAAVAREPNPVISPLSLGVAMTMARSGARGDTEAEMARALHGGLPREAAEAATRRLLRALEEREAAAAAASRAAARERASSCRTTGYCPPQTATTSSLQIEIANALLVTRIGAGSFAPSYRRLVREAFGGEVFDNASLATINAWAARRTRGKINPILESLHPDAVGVLANALYFQGGWQTPFRRPLTAPRPFRLGTGESVEAPAMRRTGSFQVAARNGLRALRLPFVAPDLALVIVLPDRPLPPGSALPDEDLAALLAEVDRATPSGHELQLPRFRASFRFDLREAYERAGIAEAFTGKADFSGMSGRGRGLLKISRVVHAARIEVDEDGALAAAVTVVEMVRMAAPPKMPEFVVDRPFHFALTDRGTGAVLFQGRIDDPRG